MAELQLIIDAIIVIQKALSVPTDQKDIQQFNDEPPTNLGVLPAFVNEEEGATVDDFAHRHPQITHQIMMRLVFAETTKKYSHRQRRAWVDKVLDAFTPNTTLGDTARNANISNISYDPYELDGTQYTTANFLLEVSVDR